MKMTFIALTAIIAVSLTGSDAKAQPQHFTLEHFDDLTFAAMADARALRWEIHNNFADSRDRDHLLRDVHDLILHLQDLQRGIYQEKTPRVLDRDVDAALETVAILKSHLLDSDFAMQKGSQFYPTGNGYTYRPATRHAGRVHVDHALQMVAAMEHKLGELHAELMLHPTMRPSPMVPSRGPISTPGHAHQPVPATPMSWNASPAWSSPVFQIGNGKITLQLKK